jgi:hypothetical protein
MGDGGVAAAPGADSTGLAADDAVAQALELLRGAARKEVTAAALQTAREEGFALGREVGRAEAARELRVRLNQLLVDLAAQPAGAAMLVGNATGIGAVPPVAVPEVARDACRPGQALWRNAAREAVVRRMAAEGRKVADIHQAITAIPGPEVPRDPSNTRHWMKAIGLWKPGAPPADVGALAQPRGAEAARARANAAQGGEPSDESPQDRPRETPQLVRARELLAMGLHPNDIKTAVKLSAMEFGIVLAAHRAAARAA